MTIEIILVITSVLAALVSFLAGLSSLSPKMIEKKKEENTERLIREAVERLSEAKINTEEYRQLLESLKELEKSVKAHKE